MMLSVQELASKLISEELATEDSIVGCSASEIQQLDDRYHQTLPKSFKDFLAVMGRSRGRFFAECDFRYPFDSPREVAEYLFLQINQVLPESAVVFLERYGSAVVLFDTKDGADPPVYVLQEGEGLKLARQTFLDWLNLAVEDAIRDYKDMLEAKSQVEARRQQLNG